MKELTNMFMLLLAMTIKFIEVVLATVMFAIAIALSFALWVVSRPIVFIKSFVELYQAGLRSK